MPERLLTLWHNTRQMLISLDQCCNVLLGLAWALGAVALMPIVPRAAKTWADETLSSHAWRLHQLGVTWPCKLIDGLFFWQKAHCADAYQGEREGRQLPPEMRAEAGQ